MRLGLIGTGKQGQRYLQEKNGGRHIVVSGSRRIPLGDVDGVIIATHPAGHKELALEAIAAGKAVLIEKPLALNLRDCMDIIDAAERSGLQNMLEVAHTHQWNSDWIHTQSAIADCEFRGMTGLRMFGHVTYSEHERDYSPWLDWAPHLLAMLAGTDSGLAPNELRELCSLSKGPRRMFLVGATWRDRKNEQDAAVYDGTRELSRLQAHGTPMRHMVEDFIDGSCGDYETLRRVYRAVFLEE